MNPTPDGVAKLAELLLSRRIAANVVLGFVLFVGASIPLAQHAAWLRGFVETQGNSRTGAVLVLSALAVLFVVSYSVANLATSAVVEVYQRRKAKAAAALAKEAADREAAQEKARAEAGARARAAEAEAERQQKDEQLEREHRQQVERLRRLTPFLSEVEKAVLEHLATCENHTSPLPAEHTASEVVSLQGHGYITRLAYLRDGVALFQLRPFAVEPVLELAEAQQRRRAEERRQEIEKTLQRADKHTRALLELFGQEDRKSADEPLHAWIESPTYRAINALEGCGIIEGGPHGRRVEPVEGQDDPCTHRITLAPDAVETVERLILGRPIARASVLLDLNQVASSTMDRGDYRSVADGVVNPALPGGPLPPIMLRLFGPK